MWGGGGLTFDWKVLEWGLFIIFIMGELKAPSLNDTLSEGHPKECLDSEISADFLGRTIIRTVVEIGDRLRDLEGNEALVREIDNEISPIMIYDQCRLLFERMGNVQAAIRKSGLSRAEKQEFWAPIATCYAKVHAIFQESFLPLEERAVLNVGDVVDLKVRFSSVRCEVFASPYTHVTEVCDGLGSVDGFFFDESVDWDEEYGQCIPGRGSREVTLPLKIVSFNESEGNHAAFVEIDGGVEKLEEVIKESGF